MALDAGTTLGPYEVTGLIGQGGMGEVYQARDTKLDRDVALKVLPEAFTSDPDRLARFEREAKVLASLNHPNIGTIYGLEEAEGVKALVLELIEGPTLADRIKQGPIPIDEALPIAKQIAEALEAAHEAGVIHRDLKPANIKVRADGTVKVLDFGLAKALAGDVPAADLSQSPTMTATVGGTREGVILGTAAYMSPEQARAKLLDKRTDIWSFGCVLFEMVTGDAVFGRETLSDTVAGILERQPPWDSLPPSTPPALRRLLRRCLAKDRRERLSGAADARLEIEDARGASAEDAIVSASTGKLPTRRRTVTFLAACGLFALATGGAVWQAMRPAPLQVTRFSITPASDASLGLSGVWRDLAIAPAGRRLVWVGANSSQLLTRELNSLAVTALTGLGTPGHPVFSPDGEWIAFFDGGTTLRRVAARGGSPITVTRISGLPRGVSWGPNETLFFATGDTSTGLQRVLETGGEPEVLTTPDRATGEVDHLWPEVLPGGQAVLFTVIRSGGIEEPEVAVLDLVTGDQRLLVEGGSHAQYAPTGHLVYVRAGTLYGEAFDLDSLTVVGPRARVLDEDVMTTSFGAAAVSISADGTLLYVPGGQRASRTLVLVDREGNEEVLPAPPRAYTYPRFSPDGTKVAVDVRDQENDIWIWDLTRVTSLRRLTFNAAQDWYPVWTPDGQRIIFASGREGPNNLFWLAADGSGAVERLTENPSNQYPYSISSDGTRLVFREDGSGGGNDLIVLELEGNRTATPLVKTPFNELNGELSPDGRWLAYQSNETGEYEIYVRPFGQAEGQQQVSSEGGTRPVWARDGRELFYLETRDGTSALEGVVMSVPVDEIGATNTFTHRAPARLFAGTYYWGGANPGRTYDVSPDGKFLMVKEGGGSATFVVVENWFEELKARVPVN